MYYLGKICKRGHDYEETGKSLKFINGGGCMICNKNRRQSLSYKLKKYEYKQTDKSKKAQQKYQLKRYYGIKQEDYEQMYENQKGKCAICGKHQSELKNRLSVDHNHITGKVRGLLCHSCNVSLGHAREDINVLLNMIVYLKKEAESLNFSVKQ